MLLGHNPAPNKALVCDASPRCGSHHTAYREAKGTSVKIEYKNTYFDLLAFSVMHQFLNPAIQGINLAVTGMIALPIEGHGAIVKIAVGAVAYVAIWLLQIVFTAIYLISRKNQSILTRHVIEIRDDCLYEETPFNRSEFFWNGGIVKVVKRGTYIALYISANAAHIIPDRAFKSKSQREEFYEAVKMRAGV